LSLRTQFSVEYLDQAVDHQHELAEEILNELLAVCLYGEQPLAFVSQELVDLGQAPEDFLGDLLRFKVRVEHQVQQSLLESRDALPIVSLGCLDLHLLPTAKTGLRDELCLGCLGSFFLRNELLDSRVLGQQVWLQQQLHDVAECDQSLQLVLRVQQTILTNGAARKHFNEAGLVKVGLIAIVRIVLVLLLGEVERVVRLNPFVSAGFGFVHVEHFFLEAWVDEDVEDGFLVAGDELVPDFVHHHEEFEVADLASIGLDEPCEIVDDLVDSIEADLLVVAEEFAEEFNLTEVGVHVREEGYQVLTQRNLVGRVVLDVVG
jgi:hypothetical protein